MLNWGKGASAKEMGLLAFWDHHLRTECPAATMLQMLASKLLAACRESKRGGDAVPTVRTSPEPIMLNQPATTGKGLDNL